MGWSNHMQTNSMFIEILSLIYFPAYKLCTLIFQIEVEGIKQILAFVWELSPALVKISNQWHEEFQKFTF